MSKKLNIRIILLAAGSSSRFGYNKLVLKIGNETLLERFIKAAKNSIAKEILVVIGAHHGENEKITTQYEVKTVTNENWEKGIGSSIKCGLRTVLAENPVLDAVIISVCDQPCIKSEIFDGLIKTYIKSNKKIIASAYNESIGVPVLYDKSLFTEMLNIPDKHGAKKYIIEKASEDIIATFPFPKGEIDIDTIEDLMKVSS